MSPKTQKLASVFELPVPSSQWDFCMGLWLTQAQDNFRYILGHKKHQ